MMKMAISLIDAIQNGDQDAAKRILQNRTYTHIDRQTSRKDGTALFWACCRGYIEIVHLLILHGADVNKCTSWGATPLHACADHNHVEILRLLLRFGSNPNLQTAQGDTACHLAAYRGHGQCVQYLVEHGADVEITNTKQHTSPDEAFSRGHHEIYQYLLAVRDIVRKCEKREKQPSVPPPHPCRNSHQADSKPSFNTTVSGGESPSYTSTTCSSHKDVTTKSGRALATKNFVGVLRLQNPSLLDDSLLSSSDFSSLCCSNDLSKQNSFCSEPQLSFRNIPQARIQKAGKEGYSGSA